MTLPGRRKAKTTRATESKSLSLSQSPHARLVPLASAGQIAISVTSQRIDGVIFGRDAPGRPRNRQPGSCLGPEVRFWEATF